METRKPRVFICYDLLEGLTYEEEYMIFETKPKLFSIGKITISNEIVSLLSVGVLEIRINEESNPKQGTSYHRAIEMVLSTIKNKIKMLD